MNKRFVNLVLADYDSRMHSLFRLDVAKHLFYPSTAQAESAHAKKKTNNNNNGGGGRDKPKRQRFKWPKPPRIKWLSPLPEPSMRFPPAAADNDDRWPSDDDAFMLLRPSSSEGTILHTTANGRTVIYDADVNAATVTVPFFGEGMGQDPVVFSVPGIGGGEEKESLYVMRSTMNSPVRDRRCSSRRDNIEDEDGGRCSGDFVVLDFNKQPYKWQHLPLPPFVIDKDPFEPDRSPFYIKSSAVIDGGRTIVVSSDKKKGSIDSDSVDEFTYCFDTMTRQWRHAGDWALPFDGRAEYVPELKTWIGLSSSSPHHHLCAVDLSAAMDAGRAPTPEHVWDDFTPPPDTDSSVVLNPRYPKYLLRRSTEWWPSGWLGLVNLGSGRFCTLKVFDIRRSEWAGLHEPDLPDEEVFAVLTGVEVLRGNDGLRMVKHKSKRCPLTQDHWLF